MISVIIPTYNTPIKMLNRCVKSVLAQTYKSFECIIVDDGSEDEYAARLDKYAGGRIRVLHKPNGGLGSARNFGVQNARGEYVFFLDSDDYISPYALENGKAIADSTGADMVVGGIVHTGPKEKISFSRKESKTVCVSDQETKIAYIEHICNYKQTMFALNRGNTGVSACSKLVKREVVLKAPFENDKYWDEDNLWNISAVAVCKKLVIADNLWYAYVINPDSMVRGYKGDRTYEFRFRAKQEYELIKRLWPDCMQGAYYMIWDGLLRYCRTDTFQKNNTHSGSRRYKAFLNAVDFPEFREAMKKIDFDNEKRFIYRLVKKTMKLLMNMKNKRAAYLLLCLCIKYIKF